MQPETRPLAILVASVLYLEKRHTQLYIPFAKQVLAQITSVEGE